jgi:alpha-amylase
LTFSLLLFSLLLLVSLVWEATNGHAANHSTKLPFSWDNATVYFVLTDRFYDGDPSNNHSYGRELDRNGKPYLGYQKKTGTFHGGDLRGLTKKLNEGYFTKLGVNAIWITSPIEQIHGWVGGLNFRHYAYHGYYALDFTEVDKNMGSREDLRTFIDTAHKQGIRVLFDVVMNHAGYPDMKTMDKYQFGALRNGWDDFYYDQSESAAHYEPYNELVDATNADRWSRWWGPDWIRLPSKYAGYEACVGNELTSCLADLPDFKTDSTQSVGLPNFLQR